MSKTLFTPLDEDLLRQIRKLRKQYPRFRDFCEATGLARRHAHDIIYGINFTITKPILERIAKLDNKIDINSLPWFTRKELADIGIINLRGGTRQKLLWFNGQQLKKCMCPHHQGKWIPISNFYKIKSKHKNGWSRGAYRTYCKRFDRERIGVEPWIPLPLALPVFIELERRLGRAEAARRIGIAGGHFTSIIKGKQLFVRAKTLRLALVVRNDAREKNEVRHKDSIHHGSYLRGREEKEATQRQHLYKTHGDQDTITRRERQRNLRKR